MRFWRVQDSKTWLVDHWAMWHSSLHRTWNYRRPGLSTILRWCVVIRRFTLCHAVWSCAVQSNQHARSVLKHTSCRIRFSSTIVIRCMKPDLMNAEVSAWRMNPCARHTVTSMAGVRTRWDDINTQHVRVHQNGWVPLWPWGRCINGNTRQHQLH